MSKQVSPVFAIIVILVVVAIGVIWFMARERTYQTQWQRQSDALQRQRDMAVTSGRARRGRIRAATPRGARERMSEAGTSGAHMGGAAEAAPEESPGAP